jgi:hypothetical protein
MQAAARLPTAQRPFTASRRTVQVSAGVRKRQFWQKAATSLGCCLISLSILALRVQNAPLVEQLAKSMMKQNAPKVNVGDTVKVGVAVVEGKGKTRTQKLEGTIIAEHGSSINKTVRGPCHFVVHACLPCK